MLNFRVSLKHFYELYLSSLILEKNETWEKMRKDIMVGEWSHREIILMVKCQAGEKSVGKVSNQWFSWLVNSPVSEVSVELLSLGELPQEQYQLEKFLVGKRSYNLFSCIWERQSKRVINTTWSFVLDPDLCKKIRNDSF